MFWGKSSELESKRMLYLLTRVSRSWGFMLCNTDTAWSSKPQISEIQEKIHLRYTEVLLCNTDTAWSSKPQISEIQEKIHLRYTEVLLGNTDTAWSSKPQISEIQEKTHFLYMMESSIEFNSLHPGKFCMLSCCVQIFFFNSYLQKHISGIPSVSQPVCCKQ